MLAWKQIGFIYLFLSWEFKWEKNICSVFKLFSLFYSQKTKLNPNLDNHVKDVLIKATIWHHSPWSLFSFWGSCLCSPSITGNNSTPHNGMWLSEHSSDTASNGSATLHSSCPSLTPSHCHCSCSSVMVDEDFSFRWIISPL